MLHNGQLIVDRYSVSKVSTEPFRLPHNTVSVELTNQLSGEQSTRNLRWDQHVTTEEPFEVAIGETGKIKIDEVYGADPDLRRTVREHGLGYVLQIAANRRVPTGAGMLRVDRVAADLPETAWEMRSAGSGSKGNRFYRWAFIAIDAEDDDAGDEPGTGEHLLLIRRNDTTGELAYHRCYTPPQVPLTALVWVAGQRWRIEESFQTGKGLTGLDQHQVRRWISWHRRSTPAMLAHAFLVVATADQRDHTPAPAGLIALTVNEFSHLFDALLLGAKHIIDSLLHWSDWRRRHQARARSCHYRRREQR